MGLQQNKATLIGAGAVMGLLVGVVGLIGSQALRTSTSQPTGPIGAVGPSFETLLNATATHSTDKFAVATGQIDEYAEGLFMLDALTGDLQCVVLNNRTAKFTSFYSTNVLEDLQVQGKKPKFLLVTGFVNFRTGGTARPANCVAYVIDANTGKYAAYGVPLTGQTKRAAAIGKLRVLDVKEARSEEINE